MALRGVYNFTTSDDDPVFISRHCRAEAERLAAERLLEEAKALIEDAKIRVDKDEIEVRI